MPSREPENAAKPRSAAEAEPPYLWASKTAVRRIREAFDGDTFLDQAFAVYLVHCELASDHGASTYQARLRAIAEKSGVSARRVSEIHSRLRQLSLLDWQQNRIEGTKELGASTFTLLSVFHTTTQSTAGNRSCTPCNTHSADINTSSTPSNGSCKNSNPVFCKDIEENIGITLSKNLSEAETRVRGLEMLANESVPEFISAWTQYLDFAKAELGENSEAFKGILRNKRRYLRPLERISLPMGIAVLNTIVELRLPWGIDSKLRNWGLYDSHPRTTA